ncbi:16S rRNA (cytidine(1402)-2'-O)-methyltransferase [Candidatus Daviesbacteria bacterium RIFCSPHIGHO2_02_FULL_41_14]|uniref:Ribosomal RNA small subunit methyltransferase I n=1 Tax=Candidatus Daviesbacteria bacterium RIFCSPLOWO2_01_FULL_40_24 TaxID=1797787 RepID=A0A1F5MIZ8_9BACT|nr:MAG: 16S rRNA (cytidine(1402)-2'-O)-methyltransferase [Candidatus Daviesbacteria bacterium RIFCSPHIGHO2_01_FULL_41_45]OGE34445.1 MAG: 16S rRNA (cytidine(1402)-2'-O)-methyltransferase [Candidatus Daviesbacteria bacterium RIFCSPHIGHO2_02_FULL_41_14]OGE65357.1 MAG: 16S rRNA (cytidine(1402)-2'-O)-methyltransferase [Candidatus Daviesbacteria bacterium RIFCSPLOWO2_01_FULL_40_24]
MLYIVPTPIGNLKDITLRALEVLKEVDAIICEDTRRTSILLAHFQIQKPLFVLNDFNELKEFPKLLQRLVQGENLALVSDAGTPLVSDPGYKLIRSCLEGNIPLDSLPGPSSILPALTLCGLPPDKFLFLGYPPEKPGHRADLFKRLKQEQQNIKSTSIFLVSPHKLIKTLQEILTVLGDINVVLASELTKIHQNISAKLISEHLKIFAKSPPRGEFVLLFNLSSNQ